MFNIKKNLQNLYSNDQSVESEEYINIEDMINDNKKNIYQIQINFEKIIVKKIGTSTTVPEIIIKEKFGPKKNLSLYNCVYNEDEFKNNKNNELFFPIIKLVKDEIEYTTYSFVIKFKNEIEFNTVINDFELYLVSNVKNNNLIKNKIIEKNINSDNIIQKIIEFCLYDI